MENREMTSIQRTRTTLMILAAIAMVFFTMGVVWSTHARADESAPAKSPRIVYPKKTDLDFEGAKIEGEIRNPGEFYFQRRPEEKFDSLVKRRKDFHREMLRDVVLSK